MDPADKIQRGIAARHLLENELLKEILNTLDGTYHAKWREAKTVDEREDLHRYVKILEQLTREIKSVALTGALEEQRMDVWAKAERGRINAGL
jgi:hypothetical protein